MNAFNHRAAYVIVALAGSLALALPAAAHHSTAMFDFAKTVGVKSTIKEFQWTNPHTWTNVDVEGGGSTVVEYGLEGMSPSYPSRNRWSKRTLKTGDKVVLQVHPLKDGRPGGFMVSVKLADGTVLYNLPHREGQTAAESARASQERQAVSGDKLASIWSTRRDSWYYKRYDRSCMKREG